MYTTKSGDTWDVIAKEVYGSEYHADVQLAVKGLKNGAADFVTKPWDNDELVRTLRDAVIHTEIIFIGKQFS